MNRTIRCLLLVSTLTLALFGKPAPTDAQEAKSVPAKAQILGVPFLSWSEAARLKYPDKDILNPSCPACEAMLIRYWKRDTTLLEHFENISSDKTGEWTFIARREGGTLEEIKGYLARGFPVEVTPTLTPAAHPLNPAAIIFLSIGAGKGITLESLDKTNFSSGYLNRMIALSVFEALAKADETNSPPNESESQKYRRKYLWIMESTLLATRLLIGYDDSRRVFLMHDPLFGPALEVGYDDFTTMWEATGKGYTIFYPSNHKEVQANTSASAYRARTADEQAAYHYVQGYALASIGKPEKAREEFLKGLAVPDISNGSQHLLLIECALSQCTLRDSEGAVASAKRATELLPQSAMAWQALAHVYRDSALENRKKLADDAENRARKLGRDRRAMEAVSKALPRDLNEWAEFMQPKFSFRQSKR